MALLRGKQIVLYILMGFYFPANPSLNASAYIVSWCRYFNNTREKFRLKTEVNFDPSEVYNTYTIKFDVRSLEATLVS